MTKERYANLFIAMAESKRFISEDMANDMDTVNLAFEYSGQADALLLAAQLLLDPSFAKEAAKIYR